MIILTSQHIKQMRKELFKGILLTAIVLLAFACNNNDDEGIVLDFDITVPDTWPVIKSDQNNMVYYAQSPSEGTLDSIREDLLITKEPIGTTSLNTYYAAILTALEEDTTFALLSTKDTTINGEPSQKFIHLQTVYAVNYATHDTIDLDAKMIKYVLTNNSNGYVITCNALLTSYDRYKPVYDTIIKTFKFKN